jgi:wyosine [tRNA(Phe)-imidazoG37] synthetase (radical SAM superfamily)
MYFNKLFTNILKMIAFGPIPSRRLGRSLGINNIPPKYCSYSCIYCQLGKTFKINSIRKEFYSIEEILNTVTEKVKKVISKGDQIDYLSFVPDGEPTLDINLGKEIDSLKSLGIKIAVFTNGSLLTDENVRRDLIKADLVSVKIDTLDKKIWRKINHPARSIDLYTITEELTLFRQIFKGKFITETMLVNKVNDDPCNIERLAHFIADLKPDKAFLAIPVRPPADKTVEPPDESTVNNCYQIFKKMINNVECLTGYEGNAFSYTGNIVEDILSITAVHPMRQDAVNELLRKSKRSRAVINNLIKLGKLVEIEYKNKKYYLRKLKKNLKG